MAEAQVHPRCCVGMPELTWAATSCRNLPAVSDLDSSTCLCPPPRTLASKAQVLSSSLGGRGLCRLDVQVCWGGGNMGEVPGSL